MTVWSLCLLGYAHELDLLEIRLAEQDSAVDVFVISEADTTYSGAPKPFHLDLGDARWAPWREKLRVVQVEQPDLKRLRMPFQTFGNPEHWARENHQRRRLDDALGDVEPDDVIVLSDLDEILRAETITRYVGSNDQRMIHPQLPMHRHFLNLMWRDRTALSIARIFPGSLHIGVGDLELLRQWQPDAEYGLPYWNAYSQADYDMSIWGWHFSWMGGVEAIGQKLRLAAHPEEQHDWNMTPEGVHAILEQGYDLQGENRHLYWVPDTHLPEHARSDRFAHLRCGPERATPPAANLAFGPDYTWRG